MTDFQPWGKTARLFRDIVITEKIDGTNAQILITPLESRADYFVDNYGHLWHEGDYRNELIPGKLVDTDDGWAILQAGSRKRWVTPDADNFGFAKFVWDNAAELVKLGPGRHYGEWWGSGIQRGYGLEKGHKVFSLFNVKKWGSNPVIEEINDALEGSHSLTTVPVLYEGPFDEDIIIDVAYQLSEYDGSEAAQEFGVHFARPEGICIYHTHAGTIFKYTPFEKEDGHKG
jgi:hypothetical protein